MIKWIGFVPTVIITAIVCSVATPANAQAHKIIVGDEVTIKVLGEEDYSIVATVRGDGKITYPYSGDIEVVGLTASELRDKILVVIRKELKRPEVLVSVRELTSSGMTVNVIGAVKTPGKQTLKEGSRMIDLIATVGGLGIDRPEWVTCIILRDGQPIKVDLVKLVTRLDLTENIVLFNGDILLFQELDVTKTHVQVSGEVVKPGLVPLPKDASVQQVLLAAGGATPKALLSRAVILRAGNQIPVNLAKITITGKVLEATLQAGDTLFLPPNKSQFMVSGAVTKPGLQDYPDQDGPLTLVQALQIAGNVSVDADLKKAQLVRQKIGSDKPNIMPVDLEKVLQKGDQKLNVAIEPGDLIFIPNKKRGGGLDVQSLSLVFNMASLLGLRVR